MQNSRAIRSAEDTEKVIDSLLAEIAELKKKHLKQIRQIEVASYKAELQMAVSLKQAGVRIISITNSTEDDDENTLLYSDRSALGKFLFRENGRPKKPLRTFLFTKGGHVRLPTRRFVLKKNGTPRLGFKQWMTSVSYRSLPESYRQPNKNRT